MDLEKLIRDKQDELRGRPEDWIDRFMDWYRRQDWDDYCIMVVSLLFVSIGLAFSIVVIWFLIFRG